MLEYKDITSPNSNEDDNDEDDDDGNNDEDGDNDGEDDEDNNQESFHSSVSVEPKRKAVGNKLTESTYLTRSRMALTQMVESGSNEMEVERTDVDGLLKNVGNMSFDDVLIACWRLRRLQRRRSGINCYW